MRPVLPALLALTLATPALAQHAGHDAMGDAPHAGMSGAMETMMEAMTFAPSGDVDIDFARAMIAHHRGAIEMARIVVETGEDPEMKALAEEIIATQQVEIEVMQAFLDRKGG